ncbi:hypothetical protein ACQ4M3_38890 [Leptolyngbya sp. AN03gr2]|uniref:hypothetical protein n=1 Tax=unclassified Leptolyngbya TaxID=2650499 RepID=UPI003D3202EA
MKGWQVKATEKQERIDDRHPHKVFKQGRIIEQVNEAVNHLIEELLLDWSHRW